MSRTSNLDRRRFIQGLGSVLGAATAARFVTASSLSVALAYPRLANADGKTGKVFSAEQLKVLAEVADVIIPTTDTPGAKAVDCHGFIDNQLFYCHTEHEMKAAKVALKDVAATSQDMFNKTFLQLSEEQKVKVLENIEQAHGDRRNAFKLVKSLVVFGYFTSEVGITQALAFLPVPGGFRGSIPCDENTKAWGSMAFF